MSRIARRIEHRRLVGPETFEPRCLMDGALPQLIADTFSVHTNDDPQSLDVLANDVWKDYSGPGRITALSFPTGGGSADIAPDGKSVQFRPSADFSGDDTFSYVVDDQFTAQATVHVVSPLAADALTVFPDGQTQTIDVLANDPFWKDYAGARRITALSATQIGGTASLTADGHTIYYSLPDDPAALGQIDHLTYIVDGKYPAEVALSLFNPLKSFSRDVPQNSDPIQVAPLDHSNFQDWPEYSGPMLVTKILPTSSPGSISIGSDGRTISYQPAKDFLGSESFAYLVDGKFSSTITFHVGAIVAADGYSIDENDPGTVLNVLANDLYCDSTGNRTPIANQVTSLTQGDHGGHAEIVQGGLAIRYVPAADFLGNETFTYVANGKYTALVTLNVSRPVRDDYFWNLNPKIVADSADNVLDVLANDFYQPGSHSITALGPTSQGGVVAIAQDGQRILYTPQPGFVGDEQFTYTIDGLYSATVRLNVESPAANFNQELDPTRGKTYRIDLAGHLPALGYTGNGLVTAASIIAGNADVSISSDGKAVLISPHDFSYEAISYTLDGKYTATFYVTFRSSRFLGASNSVADENLSSNLDVLATAPWQYYSYDQGALVYHGPRLITDAFGALHGSVIPSADGKTVTYRPDDDYVGQDSFQYIVDGHELGSATVQVIRRVRDDQFRVESSSQGNVLPVLLNDQLGGGFSGVGRITQVGTAAHGVASISADGRSLVYTPAAEYTGTDDVVYTVDGHLKASVHVTVAAPAETHYPQFEDLAALEQWLLDNAIQQYASLFGTSAYIYQPWFDGIQPYSLAIADQVGASNADNSHSETNVQVAGVDEADLTEADGDYLYVLSGGKLVITQARPASSPAVVSQTAIDGSPIGIYLSGDRLTVISQTGGYLASPFSSLLWLPRIWGPGQTTITVFDVADRSHPSLVQKTVVDGTHLDSRKIGDLVYLALNNNSFALPAPQVIGAPPDGIHVMDYPPSGRYETQEVYVQRIRDHFGELLDTMLPHFRSFRPDGSLVRSGLLLTPEEIGKPVDSTDQSMLSIVTINTATDEPGIVSATGILTDSGGRLYMNHDSIYVLRSSNWNSAGQTTAISKFTIDEASGHVVPTAHGQVPGLILDQFSVDESGGDLRIATTVSNAFSDNWSRTAENDVWVLRQDGDLLELVGSLQNLAHGESVRSVRYLGNRAIITTFPTTQVGIDPVYSIDLSDPTQPRFVGELTLPGFNQYMQFIDDTHVLTVGVNAPTVTGQPWAAGLPLQVSLFDVADFSHPHLIDQYTVSRFSSSLAQQDHHAFGWFAEFGLLALPIERSYTKREDLDGDGYRETTTYVSADEVQYFRIDTTDSAESGGGVQLVGTIDLAGPALRTAFIGDTLYAIANGQIVASSASDPGVPLGSVSWDIPPIHYWPIDPIPILTPIRVIDGPLFPIDRPSPPFFPIPPIWPNSPAAQPVAVEQTQLDLALQSARSDIANRFHVTPESALLVSIEAPTGTGTAGLKFVFRQGDQNLLYQVASNGAAELENSDFQFPSELQVAAQNAPNMDVNADGQVSPLDALLVVNDLIKHKGGHHVGDDAVLRQVTPGAILTGLDVNHDGMVTPLDALLIFNALLHQQPATIHAANALSASASPAVATPVVSALVFSQSVPMTDSAVDFAVEPAASPAAPTQTVPPLRANQPQLREPATATRQSRHDAALALTDDWSPLADILPGDI